MGPSKRRANPGDGRARLARHLAARGPTPGAELAAAVGLSLEAFWPLVNHPWFAITGKGYELTDRGRAEGLGRTG